MKVAVVTGTSRGMGEAIALSLLSKGYTVYGGSRSESSITHDRFIDIELDITVESSVKKFFEEIEKESEVIDLFINNAGFFELSSFAQSTSSDFQKHLQTNTVSSFYLYKELESFLIEEESLLINILPISSKITFQDTGSFSASSAAKLAFLNVIEKEWEKYSIRMTNLFIGAVGTSLWDEYEDADQSQMLEVSQVVEVINFIESSNPKTKIHELTFESKSSFSS